MITSANKLESPGAVRVSITEETLSVEMDDGRSLSVPLEWYPRLVHASAAERSNWRIIGRGQGIHWEDLDEDISLAGLLAGLPSSESPTSFNKWLSRRKKEGKGVKERE
jgi:hypothetical protein